MTPYTASGHMSRKSKPKQLRISREGLTTGMTALTAALDDIRDAIEAEAVIDPNTDLTAEQPRKVTSSMKQKNL